ncbi:MAG: nucleotide exchange factor GrpE [Nitrospinota bacterium]|nr:nucleotide exchange factor GrpE [Nitrospinota bacterium]MDH5789708.1 nucleotide exchange factor GrpE [Nitrospinota bacterium]
MSKSKNKDDQAEHQETSKFTVSDRRHWVHEDENGALDSEPEERLPSYVQQLKDQADSKDKQLREYIAAYKAKTAETDEIRIRLQKENENRLEQIKADFFKKLIPIVDNFNRAINSAQSSADYESLKKGIEITQSQLLTTLKESGVETIPTSGRKFNPQTDEAFMTEDTTDPDKDNEIVEELESGYLFKDKLLKPAKVKVAKLKQ